MNIKIAPIALAASLFAATAFAPATASTVITFDDLSGFGTLADGYAGVKWDNNFSYYDSPQFPYTAESDPERIFSNYSIHTAGLTDSLTFYVGAGSVFDGAYFAGAGLGTVTITTYLGGLLQSTSTSIVTTGIPQFLASGYAGSIDEVRFTGDNGFYVADNLTFDTLVPYQAVPEPASLTLMIAGLAMIGTSLRRRRADSAA